MLLLYYNINMILYNSFKKNLVLLIDVDTDAGPEIGSGVGGRADECVLVATSGCLFPSVLRRVLRDQSHG